MSVTNDFVPFCYQDTGTNLEEQADYLVDPQRTIGNQPGIASSQLVNKALRQGTAVASNIAQYIANFANVNTLDNGVEQQLLSQIQATFQPLSPTLTELLSGTGTWNATFYFFCLVANATAGATYTNNAITYTVVNTISGATILQTTGSSTPTANGGTLTKASGTGDSTITFYAYRSALYLKVRMIGGGGGGAGSGPGFAQGGTGGDTTFGTSLLVANGGAGGGGAGGYQLPGLGGTASLGIGPKGLAFTGSNGGSGPGANGDVGGAGGSSPFGGTGSGGIVTEIAAYPGIDNTGSGGGGGAGQVSGSYAGGGGGGAGGFIDATIFNPLFNYTYSIGAQGSGGGGTNPGANGGLGLVEVTEIFQ